MHSDLVKIHPNSCDHRRHLGEDGDNSKESSELAIKYATFYSGKVELSPKVPVHSLDDFSVWYTPGVAAVSRAVQRNRDLSFDYTGRWNTIAIVTDGSRVLGLGNIGPEASLPVMEGKSLIFKYLGGVDAVPLPVNVNDPDDIAETAKRIEPAFGGINLEDISSPKCFRILDRLRAEMEIPVWHDDQQGTAGVNLAALINSLDLTDRKLAGSRIVFYGAGAANIATARLLISAGANPGDFLLLDSKGILQPERTDIDQLMLKHPWKYQLALETNRDRLSGDLATALRGADILIAAAVQGPDAISPDLIATMNRDPIVFALSNPMPEILPSVATRGGAKIVATGRSDFPNQVNNSLIFPAIFRGVLDVRAKTITDEMVIAAAEELAAFARDKGVTADYIIPTMMEWEVYPRVAARIGEKAVELGLARRKISKKEIYEQANSTIARARKSIGALMDSKVIAPLPQQL